MTENTPESEHQNHENWQDSWELLALHQELQQQANMLQLAAEGPAQRAKVIDRATASSPNPKGEDVPSVKDVVASISKEIAQMNELLGTSANNKAEPNAAEIPKSKLAADIEGREQVLASNTTPEKSKEFKKFLRAELIELLKTSRKLKKAKENIESSLQNLAATNPSNAVNEIVNTLRIQLKAIDQAVLAKIFKDPAGFVGSAHQQLKKMNVEFAKSGMMMTPHLEEQYKQVKEKASNLLKGGGLAVLVGPTGTGKTVVARKIATELSEDGTYEFVSCHNKMLPDDLMSRLGVAVEKGKSPQEIVRNVASQWKDLKQTIESDEAINDAFNGKTKDEIQKILTESIIRQESQTHLVTKRVHEAVIRAAKDGKIVILDEFNYLPEETMGAMNALTSAKPGETIQIGEETVTVKEGFGILMTGNMGPEYARKSLDPAFINRAASSLVEYGYLPQDTDLDVSNAVIENDKEASQLKPPKRDLFTIGLAQLAEKRKALTTPAEAPELLWNISKVFAAAQRLGAGKSKEEVLGVDGSAGDVTAFSFKKFFLSFRNFNSILQNWKADGYTSQIDWYIYNNIIRPALLIAPNEAAQLFWLFQNHGGFFNPGNENWNKIRIDTTGWNISGLNGVQQSDLPAPELQWKRWSPVQVAEWMHGVKCPKQLEQTALQQETVDEHELAIADELMAAMRISVTEGRTNLDKMPSAEELFGPQEQ